MGTPTEETWPGHTKLPDYVQFKAYPATPFTDIFTAASDDLITILERMMSLDPLKRYTCKEALLSDYFKKPPAPSNGKNLPLPSSMKKKDQELMNRGSKRKILENVEASGLVKKLMF
uniref:Cyclindependent kinase 7like [Bombus impatiens] n=2 Tax=Lepeophtheirus salmonis TaxID=72036 RepID=A0A0K2UMR7_LEPSM